MIQLIRQFGVLLGRQINMRILLQGGPTSQMTTPPPPLRDKGQQIIHVAEFSS